MILKNSDYNILNRLFSDNFFFKTIKNPADQTYGCIVRRFVNEAEKKNNNEVISEIYSVMSKNYRNEYFYKNTLLNKLLLGKHSITTTTALTQIPIGKSKADFILINGKAVVYEIKTELDNFDRLESQLSNYYKAFNYVCLVTSESHFERAYKLLKDTDAGIYVLTKKGTISSALKQEPVRNDSSLDYSAIFKVMRKYEYESILKQYYGYLPSVSQVAYYGECYKMFSRIRLEELYPMFLKELKLRNRITIERFDEVPYELKSLIYFSQPKLKEWNLIKSFLDDNYRGGHTDVLSIR